MKRRNVLINLSWPFVVVALLGILWIIFPAGDAVASTEELPSVDSTNRSGAMQSPNDYADLHAAEPAPMTAAKCGSCHPKEYKDLQEAGGAHQFECWECHTVFHAYNPRKNNYAEIMPKCAECHDVPHGDQQVACADCHENAHAPRTLSMQTLGESCADCHRGPADQLRNVPSAHTELGCRGCHQEEHGRAPGCADCHDAHFPGQVQASCVECHAPHQPLNISFAPDAEAKTCTNCHAEIFIKWSRTASRHGSVNCTVCHSSHGSMLACSKCHRPPHDRTLTAKFKSCLGCHLDAHNLPAG